MERLRYLHMSIGVLALVAFVATGQYMDLALDHLNGMADGPRLMYRSAHIYLMFSALLNVLLGIYLQARQQRRAGILQTLGSLALLLPPFLLVLSFFTDAQVLNFERPAAVIGIYLTALGVALHLGARLSDKT